MHTNPDAVLFVGENINVMISSADGAELIARRLLKSRHRGHPPRFIVEQFVIDSCFRFSPDAKGNVAHDVVHDRFDFRPYVTAPGVSKNGEIAAGDIEADTGKRNFVFVGDNATDRLRITLVAVRAKNSVLATGVDTILDLPQRRFIVPAEYLRLHWKL